MPKLKKGSRSGARPSVPVPPLTVEKIIEALTTGNPSKQGVALGHLAKAIKVANAEPGPKLLAWIEGAGRTWDDV